MYWLITVQVDYCRGFTTKIIKKHPAEYMKKHHKEESLIFALEITKEIYESYKG